MTTAPRHIPEFVIADARGKWFDIKPAGQTVVRTGRGRNILARRGDVRRRDSCQSSRRIIIEALRIWLTARHGGSGQLAGIVVLITDAAKPAVTADTHTSIIRPAVLNCIKGAIAGAAQVRITSEAGKGSRARHRRQSPSFIVAVIHFIIERVFNVFDLSGKIIVAVSNYKRRSRRSRHVKGTRF